MTTRRGLLAGAAAVVALRAPEASAASGQDRGLLSVLAAYHDALLAAYRDVLAGGRLPNVDRTRLSALEQRAARADRSVRAALAAIGGRAAAAPATAAARGDRMQRIGYLIAAEEGTVNGWYRALQSLDDQGLLRVGAAQMTDGGRRLVVLREIAGEPLLPRAFESGGV